MKYNIKIMGKDECTNLSKQQLEDDCIIISINDSRHDTIIYDNPRIIGICKVTFDDVLVKTDNCKPITEQDAYIIKKFIDHFKSKVSTIIVHCTAGISRSGAVGCCLARYLNGDDTYLLKTGRYLPNKLVYELMSKELGLKYSEKLYEEKIEIRSNHYDKELRNFNDIIVKVDDMLCDVIIK